MHGREAAAVRIDVRRGLEAARRDAAQRKTGSVQRELEPRMRHRAGECTGCPQLAVGIRFEQRQVVGRDVEAQRVARAD